MDTPNSAAPISDVEARELLGDLAGYEVVALAVSGGPDSLALLYLAARWRALADSSTILVAMTVDHRMRAQSRAEAEFVAQHARKLGIAHTILTWEGEKPVTGKARAAREARYGLLARACQKIEPRSSIRPRALVTAHTRDDQAETLLMRLARGSGVTGLAGMRPRRRLQGADPIDLVRPLLDVPKVRLEATLKAVGVRWIEDPTNSDLAYERPRIRSTAGDRAELGLRDEALALAAHRLARADEALDDATQALNRAIVRQEPGSIASIDREGFAAAPCELQVRLLSLLLSAYGGCSPPAQLREVEALVDRLAFPARNEGGRWTLGGCVVACTRGSIEITRELGREGLPVVRLMPGQNVVWDGRFVVTLQNDAPEGAWTIKALPVAQAGQLGVRVAGVPVSVAATHPAIWYGDQLVFIYGVSMDALAIEATSLDLARNLRSFCRVSVLGCDSSPNT